MQIITDDLDILLKNKFYVTAETKEFAFEDFKREIKPKSIYNKAKEFINERFYVSTEKKQKEVTNANLRVLPNYSTKNIKNLITCLNSDPALNDLNNDFNLKINFKHFSKFMIVVHKTFNMYAKSCLDNDKDMNRGLNWVYNQIKDIGKYKFQDKNIVIYSDILRKNLKTNNTLVSILRESHNYNNEDILIFTIDHEVGHALHHRYFLDNHKQKNIAPIDGFANFLNDSIVFGKSIAFHKIVNSSEHKNVNSNIVNAISEGFADLYSCIAIKQMYSEKPNIAIKFIESLIDARIESDKKSSEFYFTVDSLKTLLIDIQNNKLQLSNFNDTYNYMSQIITDTSKKILIDRLNEQKDQKIISMNSLFLGSINARLKANQPDPNSLITYLNKKYKINLPHNQSYSTEKYLEGIKVYNESEKHINADIKNVVSSQIEKIRAKNSQNKNNNLKI